MDQDIMGDSFAAARIRLPARMFGGGLRSCADLAPAAFMGTLCRTVPCMLDRVGARDVALPGFMPQLAPLLGAGSFDAGSEEHRFAGLLSMDVKLANELVSTWRGLRHEVGDD
eukprot:9732794-Karenia_brevis.AAC.1